MQQRNNNANTTTTFLSPFNSDSAKKTDPVAGARLVPFSSGLSSDSSSITQVQHHYVPLPSIESDRVFELGLLVFKVIALLLQYLLIYKSETWAGPYRSSTDTIVHWQHIDRNVVAILLVFCVSLQPKLFVLRVAINFVALMYSFWSYSWKFVLAFTYPLVCSSLVSQNQSHAHQSSAPITSNTLPGHWCSANAEDLRYETDCLRLEFNQRVRLILFSSFLSSYYICVIPLAFCDTHFIHLDFVLVARFGCILFLSLTMVYITHYLPLELLTVFHRNGKHLGSWQCTSASHTPLTPVWDEKNPLPYESNSVVKYKRQTYRSSASCSTVAEPGNVCHTRFALLFNRPLSFPLILCSLQLCLLLVQIVYLVVDQRWFVHFSQMLLFLLNTHSLRHTVRDMYLLYLVY
jgi:hypothetical protein